MYNRVMIQDNTTIPSQDIRTLTAWLGGIIDGEGSLSFFKVKGRRNCHMFGITIVNTDKGILNQVVDIYTRMGIPCKMNLKKLSSTAFTNAKPCWEITIRQRLYNEKILLAIMPHLFSYKKEKAVRMLEYMKLHPKYARTKKDFYCEYCSHLIKTRAKRFCSLECWHKKAIGISNPNWRHGKYQV